MNFGRTFANKAEIKAWLREVPQPTGDDWYRGLGDMTPRIILHQPEASEEEPQKKNPVQDDQANKGSDE